VNASITRSVMWGDKFGKSSSEMCRSAFVTSALWPVGDGAWLSTLWQRRAKRETSMVRADRILEGRGQACERKASNEEDRRC